MMPPAGVLMKRILVGFIALAAMTLTISSVIASNTGMFVRPKADIAAVRAAQLELAPNDHVRKIYVAGDYALLGWYMLPEGAGGIVAYKRISGERWKRIYSDGTLFDVSTLVQHGVPSSVARQLCSGFPNACKSP
jgi:hypothetical protein